MKGSLEGAFPGGLEVSDFLTWVVPSQTYLNRMFFTIKTKETK